jgi:DNA repair exonuclease SbcCD ATPase subunit
MQVRGGEVTYSKKDSLINMIDRLKGIGSSLGTKLGIAVKILGCIIIICVLVFSYLYFTMEKEGTLLKNIAVSQDYINERQNALAGLESKMKEISEEIKAVENDVMARGKKIALMDLEVELQRINQEHHNIEAEIVAQENKIEDFSKRIEELKKIPLIKRLFRR